MLRQLEFVYRCIVPDVRERMWPWERNRTRCYSISFGICVLMCCYRRTRTNMTLRAEQDQMLLHFLWNLCSDVLLSTHENEYDLESWTGPDAIPLTLEFVFWCAVVDARERIWPWEQRVGSPISGPSLQTEYKRIMSKTHVLPLSPSAGCHVQGVNFIKSLMSNIPHRT